MPFYEELKVFSGNANKALAEEVCSYLHIPLGAMEVFKFDNDNTFVKILENVRQRDVFLIQSFSYPVNDSVMEMLIMIDAAKRASAGRITAVIPYFGYGRTDKKDQPRVPITARLIADLISTAGADRVLTVDLHAGQIQGFFNIPVDELTAMPLHAGYWIGKNPPQPSDSGRGRGRYQASARPRRAYVRASGHRRKAPHRQRRDVRATEHHRRCGRAHSNTDRRRN